MRGHIHGHPVSHRRLSLNHAQRSPADNQDPDMLHCWTQRSVPLHAGLNWVRGNTALTGVYVCVRACVCVVE